MEPHRYVLAFWINLSLKKDFCERERLHNTRGEFNNPFSALSRHFDTQASPTPLAWYAYQLPDWLSRLGAVCILAVEIGVPLLMFFVPVRGLRISGFSILVGYTRYMLQIKCHYVTDEQSELSYFYFLSINRVIYIIYNLISYI